MRGRVMALDLVCFMGGTPFGAPVVGWIAETVGPRWGLVGGGIVCLAAALAIAAVVAHTRRLDPVRIAERVVAVLHP
jgi:MFS family permease